MTTVPSFLLKKLYVSGSLANVEGGFEFRLKNTLATGTIIGLAGLKVDNTAYPPDAIRLVGPQGEIAISDISAKNPLTFALNDVVTVRVSAGPLTSGTHQLTIIPQTKEAGDLYITASDVIQ
ncbi:MAG: hypothetical protein H5T64_00975 [Chloroflexi bacterium]|nr:hypothetical protein [Chloroflexota bacterium]